MLVSSFLERDPLSAVLFLVKKSLSLFSNHQTYVAQTYHDEKRCLGLAGTAVSAGHGKLEGGEENEIKDSLCICQILVLFRCLLFGSLLSSFSGGSAQTY